MNVSKLSLTRHLSFIAFLTASLALGIAYPFLTGDYDRLAIPISTMIQVFGLVGMILVPVGILWITIPKYRIGFLVASFIISTFIVLLIALFATLSVGKAFGLLVILHWIIIVAVMFPKAKRFREQPSNWIGHLPLYMICLPTITLLLQLILAGPMTRMSRNHAIENASQFIRDIEEFHKQRGTYPLTLQAQNKDYYPDVVGVEKYLYAPHKKGYNLSFEQPRFLLDRFGTREWVVYNPLDENSMYSHTTWLLPSEQSEPSQGWYASGNTGREHWKYFLFD